MAYVRVRTANAASLTYIPDWSARRVDLADVAARCLAEDPAVEAVDLLDDLREVTQTFRRDGDDRTDVAESPPAPGAILSRGTLRKFSSAAPEGPVRGPEGHAGGLESHA